MCSVKMAEGNLSEWLARNLFYDTYDNSANYSSLKEHDFICLISFSASLFAENNDAEIEGETLKTAYEHFSETSAGIHVFLNTSRHKHCSIKIYEKNINSLKLGYFGND